MTDLEKINELNAEHDRTKRLLDAYDAVRAHVAPTLNPDAITLTVLDEQRYELGEQSGRVLDSIRAIRALCSHAWERIGEAKPVFFICVRCHLCTATDPTA